MGASLLLTGRNKAELEKTRASLKQPHPCNIFEMDLTQFEEVAETIKSILKQTGPVDGVIHAAGISGTLPFRNISPEKMLHFFQVNVAAALHLTQQLVKPAHINTEGGSIVFLTSVMSQAGESAKVLYSMTKGALLAASRSLAIELATKKIRVNCIAPGVVDTPMSQNAYYSQTETMKNSIIQLHPLGLGQPDDVAYACIYLLSAAGRWITGTQLLIDGGYTAR